MSHEMQQQESPFDTAFLLTLAIVFLIVIGLFMLVFSFTYIRDLETLRNVPNLVWDFACGKPIESDVILPLLLTLSIVSFIISGVLYGWRWWITRHSKPVVSIE